LCRSSVWSFVCLSARLLVEGTPRSPLALQQRNVRVTRKKVGDRKKIVSLCYEYRYTTLLGKLDAANRYAYSL
jgi:hypothetical protein